MNYQIIVTDRFKKDVLYYINKKHFYHIKDDIESITNRLKDGELIGDEIPDLKIDLDGQTFKVRSANSDTHVGKSNGYRIIYYAVKDDCEVYLLTIYYKKEDNKIPNNTEIVKLVKKYCS